MMRCRPGIVSNFNYRRPELVKTPDQRCSANAPHRVRGTRLGSNQDQVPQPDITSPNSFQVVPSNFCNCICLIGSKSSALVLSVMPGNISGSFRSCRLWACFLTFFRVRFSPPLL